MAEQSTFKRLLNNRRCLVLADAFYEWRKEGKGIVPMLFKLKNGEPFVFAGLWDAWKKPDGQTLRSFTIDASYKPRGDAARLLRVIPQVGGVWG